MPNEKWIIEIVSGRRKGIVAGGVRILLGLGSPIYRVIIGRRNARYDRKQDPIHTVSVPVISIGNITTGGTGKTPLTIWVAQHLQSLGRTPAIISRGYGARPGQKNDEAIEIGSRLPGIINLQNPNRAKIAITAIVQHQADVIVLDDGFQHRRLDRNLDIVLIDATNPFGYGHLLPRGTLREPVSSLSRASAVIITRTELASENEIKTIENKIAQANSQVPIARLKTASTGWMTSDSEIHSLFDEQEKEGQPVFAFCAIGNPNAFLKTLEQAGCDIADHKIFADHHHFTTNEIQELERVAIEHGCKRLVCTHKDLVKIDQSEISTPIWALTIGVEFVKGGDELKELISNAIEV